MALIFDSASSEVISRGNYISGADGSVSMGGWVKLDPSFSATGTVIYNGIGGSFGRGQGIRISTTPAINLDISFVAAINGSTTLALDTWYHVLATSDASHNWNIYLNGSNDGSGNANPFNNSPPDDCSIGARKNSGGGHDNFMLGSLADCAFWTRELSADEAAMLGAGYSPLYFQESLVVYKPMVTDPKFDLADTTIWSLTGTTATSDHPPLIAYPHESEKIRFGATVVGGTVVQDIIGSGIIPFER